MCGICGTYGFEDQPLLKEMCAILKHRGPDSTGYFSDEEAMLGVNRLALIDLATGDQPIHNEDSTLWIVFNGEFYNYRPWMRRLTELGHSFHTRSDTETLLHLYEEYGVECLTKVHGMFALAIWDAKKKTLFLARDRFGVKPLYYYQNEGRLIFASEMKAFIKRVPRELDRRGLEFYLRLRYVPGEMTLARRVKKLPASSYATIDAKGMKIEQYYNLSTETFDPYLDPYNSVRRLLSESVALRLVSDVPLGVFLSGGLDSSIIVRLMKDQKGGKVSTFSIGFNSSFDELKAAREVAGYFETDHHEITIDERDAIEALQSVVYHLDEPLADPAAIPTFFLAKEARRYVKGVLMGEGADEVFGGYEHYALLGLILRAKSMKVENAARTLIRITPSVFANRLLKFSSLLGQEGRKRAENAVTADSSSGAGLELVSIFDGPEFDSITGTGSTGDVEAYASASFGGGDTLRDFQVFDINNFLQHLLLRADKMTMAHSLEAREPFLDNGLVEFALSLPSDSRERYFDAKTLLRKAVREILPPEVLRRKKNRFFVPIHEWFSSELGELFWQKMDKPQLGIFDRHYLERLRSSYDTSPLYYARQMWSILNLELWYETFFAEKETTRSMKITVST